MKISKKSTTIGLGLLFAACSQGGSSPQGGSGGDTTETGGSGGSQNGGSGGGGVVESGGSGGSQNGGAGGSQSGGSGGSQSGGSGGSQSGGSGGSQGGGSGGTAKGGSGGSQGGGSGGSGGSAKGGSGGTVVGVGGCGSCTGGSTGAGGTGSGGTNPGVGGSSPGTGGTTPAANTLVTSASNAFWKSATWTEVTSTATVTVNDSSPAQTWDGFGGAFNEMGWGYLTTQAMQDQALQALFGTDGCRFAWGRIPIGASDYATSRYTDDEVPSGSTDANMASFSIDRDKQKLIPYIKAAQKVKSDIRFWASPWTPPTWMKFFNDTATTENGKTTSSNFDSGTMKSDDATLKAYAQYLVKWVQAFKDQGINVEVVSPQNEPNYLQNYPSCHWDTATFVSFVGKYFGPAITAASLNLKVMDGTLSNPSGDADIGQKVLQDATAKSFIGAIGVQWGMSDSGPVGTLKGLAGGIPIWLSETKCDGTQNSSGPAPNDFNYGTATWGYIKGAIGNGISAYNAWNMVLDKNGLGIDDARKWAQNTLIVADSGSLIMTPAYYVYRHFSQFVDPGARVVGTTGGDAVAFKNPDGSLVAVLHSTSANSSYVVAIGGKKLQFSMPNGWATIKYKP